MTVVHAGFKTAYSQSTGVVFAGRNGLDFLELRLGAVRIPEVSLRLREAQRILDGLEVERIDLLGAVVTEDESFFRNIKIKSLLAAIVQVGLYDRLLRTQRPPEVLVGNSNGDSALLVCAGQITFEQLILTSAALQTLQPRPSAVVENKDAKPGTSNVLPLPSGMLPVPGMQTPLLPIAAEPTLPGLPLPSLAGLSLTEFRAFQRAEDGGIVEVGQPIMDIKKLMIEVVETLQIARFINVGPGAAVASTEYEQIADAAGSDEVTVIDSIDLDPMLNWFWKQMRPVVGYAN